MKFDKLTIKAQEALVGAQNLAADEKNQIIDISHLLIALLAEQGIPTEIIEQLGSKANRSAEIGNDTHSRLGENGKALRICGLKPWIEGASAKASNSHSQSFVR